MNYNVFVATKPFQWLNVENIPKYSDNNILILVAYFPQANEIANNIKVNFPGWKKIIVVKNRTQAYLACLKLDIDNIYVDSDYGLRCYLYSMLKCNLYVYDEGIGTYTNNLHVQLGLNNSFKKIAFKLIGAGFFLGGNWKTSGIYVYNPNFYSSVFKNYLKGKEILSFQFQFGYFIRNNMDRISKVFNFNDFDDIVGKKVLLYITYHTVSSDLLDYISSNEKMYDVVIIKPHPHLVKFGGIDIFDNVNCIVNTNPIIAEIFILKLTLHNHLTVLHQSSTSTLNLGNISNLTFIDFKNPIYCKQYDLYQSFIKDYKTAD